MNTDHMTTCQHCGKVTFCAVHQPHDEAMRMQALAIAVNAFISEIELTDAIRRFARQIYHEATGRDGDVR